MLNGITIFFSVLGGGLLGIILGVALAMYRYEHDDDEIICEVIGGIIRPCSEPEQEVDAEAGEEK